ncbi:hypothetical protein UCDDS831_g06218 [Diplodia seriata]|uniref:Uncharacterized protein n=1 Tax=Diplodia seriata TaxID=420778 RepID=A0A0G2G1X6_9PEZI|nr:hypothetical protein UCDDS831_g06218 [Diplodia seriata]
MADTNSPPRSPPPTERRRSSFAGQAFADLFGRQPTNQSPNNANGSASYQGPITSAAAQANRRRLSLTTLGLSGSPSQSSPFNTMRSRDGFNFAENMRTRAERSSISAASPGRVSPPMHHRAKSIATAEPIREVPKVAKAPDAFQERILKGDFYMD